jgi:hypothetical protein
MGSFFLLGIEAAANGNSRLEMNSLHLFLGRKAYA